MNYAELYYARSHESLEGIAPEDFMSLIAVKTVEAQSLEGINSRLYEDRKLNVKFGTDPTGPDLHIGHIVPIRVLDLFSRAGHNIDLIFGDFTAKVGDPTGRNVERPQLTDEQISANMSTFKNQVGRFFETDRHNVRIHNNSTWLGNMVLSEVFGYLQSINLTEATQRNDFRERMRKGEPVSLAETLYGTLMGVDSVHLQSDVEIGGIDQLLNFHQTRTVQRAQGQRPEEILMTPIIEGTAGDGRKMSKSYNNYIAVRATPADVFGKIMSIPDTLIIPYISAYAPIYESELANLQASLADNPLELKKQLATYLAATIAGSVEEGQQIREDFDRRFSSKQVIESDATRVSGDHDTLFDALLSSGDFGSRSELRRLVEQGAVRLAGQKLSIDALAQPPTQGTLIQVGKRRVYSISE